MQMQYLTFIMICFRSASVRKQGRRFCSVRLEGRNPHRWFIKLSVVIGTCVVFDNIGTKITISEIILKMSQALITWAPLSMTTSSAQKMSEEVGLATANQRLKRTANLWQTISIQIKVKEDCELMACHHHRF